MNGSVLIERKLRLPPTPAQVAQRPRLDVLLTSLLERHRVLVVAATAGSGKTTAVAEAVGALDRPAAWLTVDRTDASPGRLVAYLEAALARHVPSAAGRAMRALADGVSHREAAGLLADALGDAALVVVLDDLERLEDDPEAWGVLSSFVRHAPDAVRVVLVSRRSVPEACELPGPPAAAWLDERDLAFTPDEAAEALELAGRGELDPSAAVEATGGWVTGVLFEAWRSARHVAGTGGEVDPLFGYLASHILGQLPAEAQEFLVTTSVLDEVTPRRAEALGEPRAAERLLSLREAHLPVSWDEKGLGMRCHPRFREYLLERLERRGDAEVRALRIAHGRLLAHEGHAEEATEELLRADALTDAVGTAEPAILPVIERLDLGTARRWLDELDAPTVERPATFAIAELMLCWANEDYRGTERVADELEALGEREPLARRSGRAAALMGWCYYMRGRASDAEAILGVADGSEVEAVRYLVAGGRDRAARPELSGRAFDLFVLFADYFAGRLGCHDPVPASQWADSVVAAWRIAVARATGRTRQALEMYETAMAERDSPLGMLTFLGPDVYVDAGDAAAARRVVERARARYCEIGALGWDASIALAEARLCLRLERDPVGARAVLDPIDEGPYVDGWLFQSAVDVWYGFALLLEDDDAGALGRLRRAVDAMLASDGHIELPTAAVYLAEAEWRADDEEAADRAADLALRAARAQGSNHLLLLALGDFPAVVSRRIDAESSLDSPWHELGRALVAQGVALPAPAQSTVRVRELGGLEILVDGERVQPALTKSAELLAYLVGRGAGPLDRDELLGALFDGRDDNSTRAYLRQALHHLRQALPDGAVVTERGSVGVAADVAVTSEAACLAAELAEAARLQGTERLETTLRALAACERGDYLPGVDAAWAETRREELSAHCLDARFAAAGLALDAGRYAESRALCEEVVRADPFREAAWRLLMRIAIALGDGDGAIAAYRRCHQALAEVGARPCPATHDLMRQLRAERDLASTDAALAPSR